MQEDLIWRFKKKISFYAAILLVGQTFQINELFFVTGRGVAGYSAPLDKIFTSVAEGQVDLAWGGGSWS